MLGHLLDQLARDGHLPVVLPSRLPDVGLLLWTKGVGHIGPPHLIEVATHPVGGEVVVEPLCHGGHLVGPLHGASMGHVGLLVPAQDTSGVLGVLAFLDELNELGVAVSRHDSFPLKVCRRIRPLTLKPFPK